MSVLKPFLIAAVFMISGVIYAQNPGPVSQEMRGMYAGKFSSVNYQFEKPTKIPSTMVIWVGENTCEIYLIDANNQVSPTLVGAAGQLGSYLYINASFEQLAMVGRLAVKGKPGKYSASGNLLFGTNGFFGLADGKANLKKNLN